MAWVRLDDGFYQHPKIVQAGAVAAAVQVAALCYCNRNLTDGFVPSAAVPLLVNLDGTGATWPDVIGALVGVGLWVEARHGGYLIHDYEKYQWTRFRIDAAQEKKRAAGQAGGRASAEARARANGEAPAQAESNPIPIPIPVDDDDENISSCLSSSSKK